MSEILIVDRSESALALTLNRPAKRNALSRALIAELTAQLELAEADADVRSVVLSGAPPAFCAGLDLKEVAASSATQAEHDASHLLELFETIDQLSKPVIAAVRGAAVAGGAGLVSVCDIVVCGVSSAIGYPEIKRGLVAAIVMTYLRRLVGERHAKYLLLTGENLPAREARALGLCNDVVADDDVLPKAREYAALFASYPPEALASTKRLLTRMRGLEHAAAIDEARRLNASMRLSDESRAGIGQFFEK